MNNSDILLEIARLSNVKPETVADEIRINKSINRLKLNLELKSKVVNLNKVRNLLIKDDRLNELLMSEDAYDSLYNIEIYNLHDIYRRQIIDELNLFEIKERFDYDYGHYYEIESEGGFTVKYRKIDYNEPEKYSRGVQDIIEVVIKNKITTPMIEIFDLYVYPEHRGIGLGKELIFEICNKHFEDGIYIQAGVHKKEYEEDADVDEVLRELDIFYSCLGFVDVNDKFGQYEKFKSYLFNNNFLIELEKFK